jgi:hypothetical protein
MEMKFCCNEFDIAAHFLMVPSLLLLRRRMGYVGISRPGVSVAARPQPLATEREPLNGVLGYRSVSFLLVLFFGAAKKKNIVLFYYPTTKYKNYDFFLRFK